MSPPILPTWRYYAGALLLCPAVVAVPVVLIFQGLLTGDEPWAWPALVLAWGASAGAFLLERNVRQMPPAWRAVWIGLGLALGSLLALPLAAVTWAAVFCPFEGCA